MPQLLSLLDACDAVKSMQLWRVGLKERKARVRLLNDKLHNNIEIVISINSPIIFLLFS